VISEPHHVWDLVFMPGVVRVVTPLRSSPNESTFHDIGLYERDGQSDFLSRVMKHRGIHLIDTFVPTESDSRLTTPEFVGHSGIMSVN
jgi:hypothetical protein